jgi:hypothetical protein
MGGYHLSAGLRQLPVTAAVRLLVGAVDEDAAQLAGADLQAVGVEQDRLVVGLVDAAVRVQLDVVEDALRTISRQVAENNDDYLVVGVIAVSRLSVQEQSLVAVISSTIPGMSRSAICSGTSQNVLRSRAPGTTRQMVSLAQ